MRMPNDGFSLGTGGGQLGACHQLGLVKQPPIEFKQPKTKNLLKGIAASGMAKIWTGLLLSNHYNSKTVWFLWGFEFGWVFWGGVV
jgi:hypothetical protein